MKKKFIALITTLLFASNSYAATVKTSGTITDIKMFSDVFLIYVEGVDKACNGNHGRIAIKTNNPLFSAVVASALTAKTTGAAVEIAYRISCTHNVYSWDFQHLWLK